MGIRKKICFIAVCDSCDCEYCGEEEHAWEFETKREAKEWVIEQEGWKATQGGVQCPWCTESMR